MEHPGNIEMSTKYSEFIICISSTSYPACLLIIIEIIFEYFVDISRYIFARINFIIWLNSSFSTEDNIFQMMIDDFDQLTANSYDYWSVHSDKLTFWIIGTCVYQIRIRRLCSEKTDFFLYCKKVSSFFVVKQDALQSATFVRGQM